MISFTLPVADLKPALLGLGKVVVKRATLPVLSTIRIDRDIDGRLTLSATDLDAFVSARLLTVNETNKPGSVLVPFTALNNIAKACRGDDELQISPDSKNHVNIRYPIGAQSASQRIESYPAEDWPLIPNVEGDAIPLPDPLRVALLEAMQCISADATRYILRGACIDVSDKKCQHVIGTDGRHLYSSNSFNLALNDSIIVPDHKFLAWRGFAEDGDWTLKVGGKDAKWLRLDSAQWSFTVKALEGNYPNWRQVVPGKDANQSSITFPEEFAPVIEAVGKLPDPDKTNHTLGIKLENRKLTLLGRNAGETKFTEVAFEDADTKGAPVTIFLNREFLTKALRFGLRELQINDPMSAMRFVADGRQMVVMPVRPEAATPAPAKTPEPTTPRAGAEPEREIEMPKPTTTTNGANGHETNGTAPAEKPALETAIAQVEQLRADFRDVITALTKLSDALKTAQREQRTSEREVQSVRTTLEKLQSVRI